MPRRPRTNTPLLLCGVFVVVADCSPTSQLSSVSGDVVYGTDDRVDYFDLTDDPARTIVSGSMVALVSTATIDATGGDLGKASTWAQFDNLCPGEPFANQPAAAFCGGVLVDWDLVLTADHCTRLYGLNDFKVVFDYFYTAPGEMAVTSKSTYSVAEIVSEELDDEATVPRLHYAWLRLSEPVAPPRRPVPIYGTAPPPQLGDAIISVGTPGGVPLKWDSGGRVRDTRAPYDDYFITNSDNSAGSSGGAAFDSSLALTGIAARGGTDFVEVDGGCNTTVHEPADAGQEQSTYAFRALQGLCDSPGGSKSSLCRPDCGTPCSALPPLPLSDGCSVAASPTQGVTWSDLIALGLTVLASVRRKRLSSSPGASYVAQNSSR